MAKTWYDPYKIVSIENYAKLLQGSTLRQKGVNSTASAGKGGFGQTVQKSYFNIPVNSLSQPDFIHVGIELKCTPLKEGKNCDFYSKERMSLGMINYHTIIHESFIYSSFLQKNSHLLIVFYLPKANTKVLDYMIHCVGRWQYDSIDLQIIKQDWEKIKDYTLKGDAHLISGGITNYLEACTKGRNSSHTKSQPNSNVPARSRAFALKSGYINHILYHLCLGAGISTYGRVIQSSRELETKTIDDIIIDKLKPYFGKLKSNLLSKYHVKAKAKNHLSNLVFYLLGLNKNQQSEEIAKSDIVIKSINLEPNGSLKESVSLPAFHFKDIVSKAWEDSSLYELLNKKYLFVIFEKTSNGDSKLKEAKFYAFNAKEIDVAKEAWLELRSLLAKGLIVKAIKNNRRSTYLKDITNDIVHIRPHAKNNNDCYDLPVADKFTGESSYTKQSFWINNTYILSNII